MWAKIVGRVILNTASMSLHPPSFFSAPRPAAKAKTSHAQQQTNEPERPPTEDALAALKRENIALK